MSGHHHHHHDHTEPPTELVLRVKALESLLVEKGLVDPAAIDLFIDAYETKIGPRNDARVVARAWSDPASKSGYCAMRLRPSPPSVSRAGRASI